VFSDITDRKQAETIRSLLLRQVVNVQEAERARLARELHDETAQSLAALLIGLSRLRRARTLDDTRQQAERLHAVADRVLTEVRRMSRGLRPQVLDEFGLAHALTRYAAEFGEMRSLAVTVRAAGLEGRRLPSEVEIALFRIMQEALSNVARHAKATTASVAVDCFDGVVVMTATDDGIGFDVAAVLGATDGARPLPAASRRTPRSGLGRRLAAEPFSAPGHAGSRGRSLGGAAARPPGSPGGAYCGAGSGAGRRAKGVGGRFAAAGGGLPPGTAA
jgi:signal transduction histidine kinase